MSRSRESRPRGSRKQQTKITMESDHPKGRKVKVARLDFFRAIPPKFEP